MEQSFFEWLQTAVPLDRAAVFVVFGVIGAVGNYVKMWVNREIECCLIDYLVHKNPRRSVLAMMAFAGGAATFILSGTMHETPWGVLVTQALTAGYAADSLVNKKGDV